MFTAVIGFSGFGFFGKNSCSAKGAFAAGFLNDSFGVLASGIAGACKEFSEAAGLNDHFSAAFFADNVGFLFRDLDFFALVFLGDFKGFLEILIEFFHHMDPVGFSVFNFIKVLFHLRGEIHVNNAGKMFGDKVNRNGSEGGGLKGLAVFFNVVSADDGGDDRRIGGRSSDSVFSRALIREASVYLEGGAVKCWFGLISRTFRTSPEFACFGMEDFSSSP